MNRVPVEISKETYEEYRKMSRGEFHDKIEETISTAWRWGYGWYGCELKEEDGKYYVVHTIGSTCD